MGAPPADPRQAQRTAAIISAAFVVTVAMYGMVLNVLRLNSPRGFEGLVSLPDALPIRTALWGVAAVVLVMIPALRRRLLTRPAGEDERSGAARLSRCAVITNALAEVPALLGFVLALLGGFFLDFYVLAAVSVLLLLLYFPRSDAWEEWLKQRP